MEDLDKFVGVPCEQDPGAEGGFELRSKVRLSADPEEFTDTAKGECVFMRRRFRINMEDLAMSGHTAGNPGSSAANRGTTAVSHAEDCRARIVEEVEKVGDEGLEREKERLRLLWGGRKREAENQGEQRQLT